MTAVSAGAARVFRCEPPRWQWGRDMLPEGQERERKARQKAPMFEGLGGPHSWLAEAAAGGDVSDEIISSGSPRLCGRRGHASPGDWK
jgi:hypothetical protein